MSDISNSNKLEEGISKFFSQRQNWYEFPAFIAVKELGKELPTLHLPVHFFTPELFPPGFASLG